MMSEEKGKLPVNYIHYIDGKKSSNIKGFPNNIFHDVIESLIDGDFIIIKQRLSNGNIKQTYIPTSNVGLIEAFTDEDDFYEAYPNVARLSEDRNKYEVERDWVKMNNAVCGHDFTRIKFWPFEGKKSEIDIYPLFDRNKTFLRYTKVLGIERKWNHDIKGNEIWIRTIELDLNEGFKDIERIGIIHECDIKKFIIKRADHEDLEIKVNGGTYRDE